MSKTLLAVGAIMLLAAACGGPGATTVPGTASPPAGATPTEAAGCVGSPGSAVAIADNAFNPGEVTVAVGGSVTWANADQRAHTVTFDDGPDCGQLSSGGTVTRTFDAAGSFAYHCTIHGSMRGTVVVQ